MIRALVVLVVACGGSPATTNAPSNATPPEGPRLDPLPADVNTLVERWENCWHFAGEEGTDPARRKEIEDGLANFCPGNENERARLKARYKDRADVQDALKKLDEMQ